MNPSTPIIFFDGECALCTGVVQFILKRDNKKRFRFASLQGNVGRNLFLFTPKIDSIVLKIDEQHYIKSNAVLEICRLLGNGWHLLYMFRWIPRIFRDGIYDFIAKNRYRWFGKRATCWMPDKKWDDRFLI